MSVGAGLSASFGIATETTVGTPVAVTRFYEFDNENVTMKKGIAQGAGLRQGGRVKRAARRNEVSRAAAGDVTFDATTNGLGLILTHMLGSFSPTINNLGGGLYQQVHNLGSLNGHSFTTQIVRPETTGVLTSGAYTYPGCKVTGWEFSVKQDGDLSLKLTIDALDEATPSNGFASTTLSAATTVGGTTISTVAAIPAGAYVVLDSGVAEEVVQTVGAATGSGPYVSTVTAPIKAIHATGAYVGSATGVNYGAATALQTATYNASTNMFNFAQGSIVAGGTTTTTSGIFTNSGGAVVANVRSVTLTGKNSLKTDRFGLGSYIRSEQIENGWMAYTADLEVEYNGRAFYDAYATDAPTVLLLKFQTPSGAVLSFYAPTGFQEDGSTPNVAGPDIIIQKLKFTILDDGANGALQAVYTSTDSAV